MAPLPPAQAGSPGYLAWWRPAAMLGALVATGLGIGVGVAQRARPVAFPGGGVLSYWTPPAPLLDAVVFLSDAKGSPSVVITRISLIGIPGYAPPRIRHAFVSRTGSGGYAGAVWPPPRLPTGARTSSPNGYVLSAHQIGVLWLGLQLPSANRPAAWAGVSVTYVENGAVFTSQLWQSGEVCVDRRHLHACWAAATKAIDLRVPPS